MLLFVFTGYGFSLLMMSTGCILSHLFTLGKAGVWSGATRECRERVNVALLCLKQDDFPLFKGSQPLSDGNR